MYVRSKKWAMDPTKLTQFSKDQLIPSAADKYLHHLIHEEMPRSLKRYMELELFPWIQLKVRQGISLSTAHHWLHKEGFRYISYNKELYFDGHNRPDVVAYCQNHFLLTMQKYQDQLVQYVGDVQTKKHIKPQNFVEHHIVLTSHDETTTQANDGQGKGWVLGQQFPLQKKGAGRGLHESHCIQTLAVLGQNSFW